MKRELGSLDKVTRIVRLSGFVNSDTEFYQHPKVINAASDLFLKYLEIKENIQELQ